MPGDLRWTVADIEDVERLAGIDFADLVADFQAATLARKLRICAALVYVQGRKTDPALTFEAAMSMTADELMIVAGPLVEAVNDPAPLPG